MNLKDIDISQIIKIFTLIAICFGAYFHFDLTFAKVKNVDAQMQGIVQDIDYQFEILAMNIESNKRIIDLTITERQLESIENSMRRLKRDYPNMQYAPQSVQDMYNDLEMKHGLKLKEYDALLK